MDPRLHAYAAEQGLSLSEARARLLTIALDHLDARRRGGHGRHQRMTTAERSASAARAARIRWAARHKGSPP